MSLPRDAGERAVQPAETNAGRDDQSGLGGTLFSREAMNDWHSVFGMTERRAEQANSQTPKPVSELPLGRPDVGAGTVYSETSDTLPGERTHGLVNLRSELPLPHAHPDGHRHSPDERTRPSEQRDPLPRGFTPQEDGSATHTVRPGENLWRITRDALTRPDHRPSDREILEGLRRIARENRIADPNKIRPDQQIRIPSDMLPRPETPERPEEGRRDLRLDNRGASPEFEERMRRTIDQIPPNVRQFMAERGVEVRMGRSVTDVEPDLRGVRPRGWPEGRTWDNSDGVYRHDGNRVVMGETMRDRNGNERRTDRAEGVVRHELGHAFDHALGEFSSTPEFQAAYERDTRNISPEDRARLSYVLQPGTAGREETFAEVFAGLHGGTCNPDQNEVIMRNFPSVAQLIRQRMAQLPS